MAKPAQFMFRVLENYALRSACRVSLTSEGFLPYFSRRFPGSKFKVVTNGVDDVFCLGSFSDDHQPLSGLPEVLYAGNIGSALGVEQIIPFLAKVFEGKFLHSVIGSEVQLREFEAAIWKPRVI